MSARARMAASVAPKAAQPAPPDTTWETLAQQQKADGLDATRLHAAVNGQLFAMLYREGVNNEPWHRVFITRVERTNNWFVRDENLRICEESLDVVKGYTQDDKDDNHSFFAKLGMYYTFPFDLPLKKAEEEEAAQLAVSSSLFAAFAAAATDATAAINAAVPADPAAALAAAPHDTTALATAAAAPHATATLAAAVDPAAIAAAAGISATVPPAVNAAAPATPAMAAAAGTPTTSDAPAPPAATAAAAVTAAAAAATGPPTTSDAPAPATGSTGTDLAHVGTLSAPAGASATTAAPVADSMTPTATVVPNTVSESPVPIILLGPRKNSMVTIRGSKLGGFVFLRSDTISEKGVVVAVVRDDDFSWNKFEGKELAELEETTLAPESVVVRGVFRMSSGDIEGYLLGPYIAQSPWELFSEFKKAGAAPENLRVTRQSGVSLISRYVVSSNQTITIDSPAIGLGKHSHNFVIPLGQVFFLCFAIGKTAGQSNRFIVVGKMIEERGFAFGVCSLAAFTGAEAAADEVPRDSSVPSW